jgi:hypothetical protein
LTFLLALSACSDITEPTSPVGSLDRPSYDTYTYGSYELVTGSSWNLIRISNSRVIGAAGGRVNLGLHELVVPAGAVKKPTVFRMSKQLGPHVLVDLSATDKASGAPVDSFARSVELRLSYRFIRISEADLRRAVVLWLKDESASGELVPVPTQVDRRTKHLIGSLTHFSQYAMGLN